MSTSSPKDEMSY